MSESSRGFTMVEVVIALFLISIGVLATTPLFIYAAEENASGDDLSTTGMIAVQHLERFRGAPFDTLLAGGSLTTDVTGYFNDSDPDFIVRWQIVNASLANRMRLITVRVTALRSVRGEPKEVTVTTLRAM